jgi:hypothetical protein
MDLREVLTVAALGTGDTIDHCYPTTKNVQGAL